MTQFISLICVSVSFTAQFHFHWEKNSWASYPNSNVGLFVHWFQFINKVKKKSFWGTLPWNMFSYVGKNLLTTIITRNYTYYQANHLAENFYICIIYINYTDMLSSKRFFISLMWDNFGNVFWNIRHNTAIYFCLLSLCCITTS